MAPLVISHFPATVLYGGVFRNEGSEGLSEIGVLRRLP
jgi:hypothetical protein